MTYYHGGAPGVKVGDDLLPGSVLKRHFERPWVFITTSWGMAIKSSPAYFEAGAA